MPDFKSNGIIHHEAKTYFPGATINLTQEQADALGARVIPMAVAAPEKAIADMNLKELKATAKAAKVPGYTSMDKGELVTALSANPAIVEPDSAPDDVELVSDDTVGG